MKFIEIRSIEIFDITTADRFIEKESSLDFSYKKNSDLKKKFSEELMTWHKTLLVMLDLFIRCISFDQHSSRAFDYHY